MFPSFELFGRTIGTYPLMALIGFFVAGIFACYMAKKKGHNEDEMIVFLLIAALGAIIGGHLFYSLTNIPLMIDFILNLGNIESFKDSITKLSMIFGGSVFYGGLIGGTLTGIFYMLKKKINIFAFADILAPTIPLFHFFGRIGCFLGGCCYGVESNFGFVLTHSPIVEANGVSRFPIQLVEAVFNLIIFFLLAALLKNRKFEGRLFFIYLIIYTTARFIFEFWRGDLVRGFVFGLSTSQFTSMIIFIVTIISWMIIQFKKNMQNESLS